MQWNCSGLLESHYNQAFVSVPVRGVDGAHKKQLTCISSFVRKSHSVARRARRSHFACVGPSEPSKPSEVPDPSEPSSKETGASEASLKRGLEKLYRKSPSEWPPENDYDEQVLEEIKSSGMKGIEKIAGDLKEELTDVDAATEKYAKDLVDDEIGKVLTKYQEKQEKLLQSQKLHTQEIRKEVKRIQELASSVEKRSKKAKQQDFREKILLSLSGLFGIAALYFFWNGIVEDSSIYLQNAAVDAVAAAIIAFLSSSSFARGNSDDRVN